MWIDYFQKKLQINDKDNIYYNLISFLYDHNVS